LALILPRQVIVGKHFGSPRKVKSARAQAELDTMAWELNIWPRKTLGWRSAAEVFFDNVDLKNAGLIPTAALGV